ncbi:MAG: ATP-dependent DNA helicase RecQ [Bacteroidota bacterium]|nr:ATP-dependent DNA helicase RecQ [Bacteroidota bacterium]
MPYKNLLIKYWGYSSFRPLQEEIIQSVMDGKDTLALMPTGGGKSICFQIPGLAMEGVCLVITPLIALMKDQVENLRKKGIKAAAIYSGMHAQEIGLVIDNCIHGGTKFLYVSPERLATRNFREALREMKINLLAVDEAHCISQWGYDFRPPYLQIADIRQFFPRVPVLALTATATQEVVGDIQDKLRFRKLNVLSKSFERKTLSYSVLKVEDKNAKLLRILGNIKGSGIIYVRNRRKTREVADFLRQNKISADHYHAGLTHAQRNEKQASWLKGALRVMVSTNAFGMGIDKSNVRFVIHLDIPDSIEAYFQEAGRAGRDENMAYAVMLYSDSDVIKLRNNLANAYPPIETIKAVYHGLGNYYQLAIGSGRELVFDFDISDFCNNYDFKPVIVYNALKFLEKESYLSFEENADTSSKIYFPASKEDLYRFQIERPKYDSFIKTLLRSYSGLFNDFVKIKEGEIAKRTNLSEAQVVTALKNLDRFHLLAYIQGSDKPRITYLQERVDRKNLLISRETYQDRKESAMKRIKAMIDFVVNDHHCRSQQLLAYFGEKDTRRCGICDVCKERNKIDVNEMEFDSILDQIKPVLQQKPHSLLELIETFPKINEEKMIRVIRWLKDNDKIEEDDNLLSWKKQFRINF